jgi:hypothetical protein
MRFSWLVALPHDGVPIPVGVCEGQERSNAMIVGLQIIADLRIKILAENGCTELREYTV